MRLIAAAGTEEVQTIVTNYKRAGFLLIGLGIIVVFAFGLLSVL